MPDVVDVHVVEPGPHTYGLPRPVDVGHVRARLGSRNDPGIAGLAWHRLQDADRRRRQVDRAGASLPVGEVNLGRVEIDMLPSQGEDFVSAAAGEHQQADRRYRAGGDPAAFARGLVQHLTEAGEFRVGQEPLAPALGVLLIP